VFAYTTFVFYPAECFRSISLRGCTSRCSPCFSHLFDLPLYQRQQQPVTRKSRRCRSRRQQAVCRPLRCRFPALHTERVQKPNPAPTFLRECWKAQSSFLQQQPGMEPPSQTPFCSICLETPLSPEDQQQAQLLPGEYLPLSAAKKKKVLARTTQSDDTTHNSDQNQSCFIARCPHK